jgi:hypothetical protein
VKLHKLARFSLQRDGEVIQTLSLKRVFLIEGPFALLLLEVSDPAYPVYDALLGLTLQIKGSNQPSSCLFGAPDECVEPTRCDQYIVINEDKILGFDLTESEVSCLVRS